MKICVARERMIGWYHTGPKLHNLFKRFIARPVMVILDVRAQVQVVGMPTDAYFAVEESKDMCGKSFNLSLRNKSDS
jgi:26S proteasome regulatory subunit N8